MEAAQRVALHGTMAAWLSADTKNPASAGFLLIFAADIEGAATSPDSCSRCPLPKRYHVDGFAAQMSFHRKLHVTIGLRKERMISSASDIVSVMKLGAPLTH